MKLKLLFLFLMSLFLVSCSTHKNLAKNTKSESECVVPQEDKLTYKSQKLFSQIRYNSKINHNKTFAKRNRTKSIQDPNSPQFINQDGLSEEDYQAGRNPFNILIDLRQQMMFPDSQEAWGISIDETPFYTHGSDLEQASLERRDNRAMPAAPISFTESEQTSLDDESLNPYMHTAELKNEKQERRRGDHLLYLAGAIIGLLSYGSFRGFRKSLTKITRWAKANPGKAQGLIAGLQVGLMGMAFYSGHNLREMGYEISETPSYIFAGLMTAGFLATPFLARKETIALPQEVNSRRLKYLGIILSSLMILTTFGNNYVANHPDTKAAEVISKVDQTLTKVHDDLADDGKINEPRKYRWEVLILTLLATVILAITLCAGICIAVLGGSAIAILGGGAIAVLSIFGIVKVFQWLSRRFKIKT